VTELGLVANAVQAQRWNGASGSYWIKHRERHLAEHQHLTPHLFRAARISPGERVLDVGCGCGDTTIAAAQAANGAAGERTGVWLSRQEMSMLTGCAVGLDLSAPMLRVARLLAKETSTANVGFAQGDAQVCPLRPSSCDVVISNFGVMFFNKPSVAFESIATVLRPGGRLAFLCWQDDTKNEVFAIPLRAFGVYKRLPDPDINDMFVDPQLVMDLLSSTGWKKIEITPVNEQAWIGSDVDDVMSYIRGMPVIRSLAADFADQALTERVLANVAEQYASRQRCDGVWVRAAAWLVTALRAPDS